MKLAAGDDWQWAAAIAEKESGTSPFAALAAGAHGEQAFGIWQMHDSFVADMLKDRFPRAESLFAARGNPFVQAAALSAFWTRYSAETVENRLLIYHYGHNAWEANMAKAKTALAADVKADVGAIVDPDGYVDAVKKLYAAIAPPAAVNGGKKKS
ncbi:MAG: hypothetical protein WA459_00175 [Stellaceae bacterium]